MFTAYSSIFAVVLPVYLTMTAGWMMRRLRFLPPQTDEGLMKLVVHVLSPCLIFHRVVGSPSVMDPWPVLVAAGLGFGLVTIGMVISYVSAPLAGLSVSQGRRTFALACGLQNYGFVAIPIVSALFPQDGTIGVLFTFMLGVELACWTSGVGLLTGFGKAPWLLALNTPVLAILFSLSLNFSGLHTWVPDFAMNTAAMIGACAVPIAVIMIGASIADLWGKEAVQWKVAMLSPLLRLGIIPLIIVAAALWLPLTLELKRVLIIQSAMPSAVFNIMIARHYGGHVATAIQVVLATTLVSLITTPLVLAWGMPLIHSNSGQP